MDTKAKYLFEGSAVSVAALEEFGRSMLAGTAKRVFMSGALGLAPPADRHEVPLPASRAAPALCCAGGL